MLAGEQFEPHCRFATEFPCLLRRKGLMGVQKAALSGLALLKTRPLKTMHGLWLARNINYTECFYYLCFPASQAQNKPITVDLVRLKMWPGVGGQFWPRLVWAEDVIMSGAGI